MPATPPAAKPRILVHTDVSSLTAGVRELDDGQSLARYLLFSHEFDVQGISATSNLGHGQTVRPEFVRHEGEAYALLWPNLLRHPRVIAARRYCPSALRVNRKKELLLSHAPLRNSDRPIMAIKAQTESFQAQSEMINRESAPAC
jgi:hypothetical protein